MSNITLADAKAMIQRCSNNRSAVLKTQYSDILPASETFTLTDINSLINQQGCTAFRVYFGMKADFSICTILVGVNSKEEDILVPGNLKIIEEGKRCPPNCPPSSLTS